MNKLLPLLFFFTCISCNNQGSIKEKDNVIQSQEQKIKELEERLNKVEQPNRSEVRDSVDYSQTYIPPPETKKEYYSIGSTESEVLDIQGEPSSITDFGSGKMFMYGASIITFRNGKVVSYSNLDRNLKIHVSSKTPSESNSNPQTASSKGKTKYIFYSCLVKQFGEYTTYNSKIFTINDYTTEKLYRLRDCLVDRMKITIGTGTKIDMMYHDFDSYNDASEKWSNRIGNSIFGDDLCGYQVLHSK